jgi:hypothetical protein
MRRPPIVVLTIPALVLGSLVSVATLWPAYFKRYPVLFTSILLCSAGFLLYMCTIDVPLYFSRWLAQAFSRRVQRYA